MLHMMHLLQVMPDRIIFIKDCKIFNEITKGNKDRKEFLSKYY